MSSPAAHRLIPRYLPILAIIACCTAVLFVTQQFSGNKIKKNRETASLAILKQLMPLPHSNNIFEDRKSIDALNSTVYRARSGTSSVGLVFMPLTAQGYSGPVQLAMGVSYAGEITAVRVTAHSETPGLGDAIDLEVSPWILQFNSRHLDEGNLRGWAVQEEGGEFDAISGATITSRNLVNKIRDTLQYYKINREELFK